MRFIKAFPCRFNLILQIIIINLQKKQKLKETNLLCQVLYKISKECSEEKHIFDYLKEIGKVLGQESLSSSSFSYLIAGIYRLFRKSHNQERMMNYFIPLIKSFEENKKNWKLYLLAKESMIYGFHSIAGLILEKLQSNLKDEMNSFWAKTLLNLANAEIEVVKKIPQVSNAVSLLNASQIAFSSTSFLIKTKFQKKYLKLRERYLKAIQKVQTLTVFLKEDVNKMTYKILQDSREDFKKLHEKYNSVKRKFFDIDNESFEIFNSYQLSCLMIYQIISIIISEKFENYSLLEDSKFSILNPFYKFSKDIHQKLQNQVSFLYSFRIYYFLKRNNF